MYLVGPHGTNICLDWYSKKQTVTAPSSTDAEMTSAGRMIKYHQIPMSLFWDAVLGRSIRQNLWEDNKGCLANMQSGYSAEMRYLLKTQRISVSFLHDVSQYGVHGENGINVQKIDTKVQRGDLLTKGLTPAGHASALGLNGLF